MIFELSFAVGAVTVTAATALAVEQMARQRDLATGPGGRRVEIGDRRLHLEILGSGGPAVVLESGGATPTILMRAVAERLASETTVCLYDRAGFGWSDPAPADRGFEDRARDLSEVLQAAGVEGPFVIAGASFGGLLARTFARLYPAQVAGLVLIDAAEEEVVFSDYERFRRMAVRPMRIAPLLTRLGLVRRAIMRRPQALGLPPLPPEHRRALAADICRAGYWRAARDEIAAYDRTPLTMRGPAGFGLLGDLPLTVIAHGQPIDGAQGHLEPGWRKGQERLTALSSAGRLVVAERSGHAVTVTEPDLVADEILRMVHSLASSPSRPPGPPAPSARAGGA